MQEEEKREEQEYQKDVSSLSSEQEESKKEGLNIEEEKKEEKSEEPKEEKEEVVSKEENKEEATLTEQKGKEEAKPGEKKWYVIQTYSGQEDKVKDNIIRNIENMNLQDRVFKVLVPEEETVEIKEGKKIVKKKKMFPGYVFLEMILDNQVWYVIRGTPGVAKFIGSKVEPTPVSDKEMQRILKQIGLKEEKLEAAFEVGDSIRIISGPFRGYTGSVDEVNPQKGKLKALINIFGRDTPVEVSFEQIQKIT